MGPADTPVVMLNLLKFKARAEIPGEEVSGQEAYGRYAAEMRKGVEAAGGRTQGLEGQWLLATTEASI